MDRITVSLRSPYTPIVPPRSVATPSPAPPADAVTLSGASPAATQADPVQPLSLGRKIAVGLALVLTGTSVITGIAHHVSSRGEQTISTARPADATQAVRQRTGSLLGTGMILKADQFPTLQNATLPERLDGAPNFRQLPNAPVFGVAQPTVDGIRNVLTRVGAGPQGSGPAAVWTNLREEPVVYVNGRPFNPRAVEKPFANLEFTNSTTPDVEARDARLKGEVQDEARRNGGMLLIHEEAPDGSIQARYERVQDVRTPAEVYAGLQKEGFRVDYARVPVSDEKAPAEEDFEALTRRLSSRDPKAPRIFNCHAGRGRTTTGMVVADLLSRDHGGSITKSVAVREDIREQGKYDRGSYKVVLSLIRAVEQGPQSKADADAAIDRSGALQNLRRAINEYRQKSLSPGKNQDQARTRGEDYLRRYFYLISYDAYLKDQAPKGFTVPFGDWMGQNDLHRVLDNLELAMGITPRSDVAYA